MSGKENFDKMLKSMINESISSDLTQAGKDLAKLTNSYYSALVEEGFTKAQAIHFTDLFLAGILRNI